MSQTQGSPNQGNQIFGIFEVLGRIAEAIASKDLRDPANWNLLFDLLAIILVLGLGFVCGFFGLQEEIPLFWCVITFILCFIACFFWVIYVYSKNPLKRSRK